MAKRPAKVKFVPTNPKKYAGSNPNIICRSGWEHALCIWLDTNPNVLRWVSEEIVIPYMSPLDNRMHRYFPDYLVEMKDAKGRTRKLLVEVKPHKETIPPVRSKGKRRKTLIEETLTWERNQAKWMAAESWCDKTGAEFVIWTERHLVALGVKIGT